MPTRTGPIRTLALDGPRRAAARIWIAVGLVVLLLGFGSVLAVRAVASGPEPEFLSAGLAARPERPEDDDVLRIAGDGSALPLARALAAAYTESHPNARVRVHQSIGSDGGIRATAERAIDVGLSARPLAADERAAGLRSQPLAIDAVVFAAHEGVPAVGVTAQGVLDLYAGRRATWDDGTRVRVVLREAAARHHPVVEQAIRGFSSVNEASDREGRWHVVLDERTMLRTLVGAPGSIGLLDLGSLAGGSSAPRPGGDGDVPRLKVLALDGVEPTEATVRDGRYPLHLSLSLVTRHDDATAAEFLAFARSPAGRRIVVDTGYFTPSPVDEGAR